jgi:hypothetical protein
MSGWRGWVSIWEVGDDGRPQTADGREGEGVLCGGQPAGYSAARVPSLKAGVSHEPDG